MKRLSIYLVVAIGMLIWKDAYASSIQTQDSARHLLENVRPAMVLRVLGGCHGSKITPRIRG